MQLILMQLQKAKKKKSTSESGLITASMVLESRIMPDLVNTMDTGNMAKRAVKES